MPNPDILTEIPPISGQDCFVVFDRYKREFCFPVHIHKEYELNSLYFRSLNSQNFKVRD